MIEKLIERIKNWILPLLFGSSVAHMIIRCYHAGNDIALSMLFFLYALVLFALFEFLRKFKVGGLLYVVILGAVLYYSVSTALRMSFSGSAGLTFNQWFYGVQNESTLVPAYSLALMVGGGFFFVSILYYFTQVIYRGFGTLLITLFPLVIYSKRTDSIVVSDMIIVLAFYIAVMVHNRQMKSEKDVFVIFDKSYLVSIGVFVAAATVVTAVVPKPNVISKQEADSNYFDNLAVSSSAPNDYSSSSSGTGGGLSEKIIMIVHSNRPLYLRRQSYDFYYNGRWHTNEDLEYTYKVPNPNVEYNTNITNQSLVNAILEYIEDRGLENIIYPVEKIAMAEPETVTVEMQNNFYSYFPAVPLNTILVQDSNYKRCIHGEFRPLEKEEWQSFNYGYTFEYYPVIGQVYSLCYDIDLSMDDVLQLLSDAQTYYRYMDEEKKTVYDNLYREASFADEAFSLYVPGGDNYYSDDISDKVVEIAEKITQGLSTPYEKAEALEGYFTEEKFEYDPNYLPIDSSVEYFITTSKKGACGDFATAMTLMARAVGLNARYVEGFIATEPDRNNEDTYIVREKHSHAYTEVYIPGVGWMTFEPTVPGFAEYTESEDMGFWGYATPILKIIMPAIVLLAVLFVFRNPLSELVFRLDVIFLPGGSAVVMMYNRIVKKLSSRLKIKGEYTSPKQVRLILEEHRIDAEEFVSVFERTCYGNYPVTEEEKNQQYQRYSDIKRLVGRIQKKKNSKKLTAKG